MALTASPLFGTPETRNQNKNLVEFRAGKMFMSHGNMVHPDTRKGLVYVYQSADGLMHFCWKDRTSGAVEDVSTTVENSASTSTFISRRFNLKA